MPDDPRSTNLGWTNICVGLAPDGNICGRSYWVFRMDGADAGKHTPKVRYELDRTTRHQHREVTP